MIIKQIGLECNEFVHIKHNNSEHNEIERSRRRSSPVIVKQAAFHYDPAIDYCADKSVTNGESIGLCCTGGKVKLPQLVLPPDPLRSLVSGMGNDSKHFLANIQKYYSCFQITSFGATHFIIQDNFMPTFKVLNHIFLQFILTNLSLTGGRCYHNQMRKLISVVLAMQQ